MTQLSKVAGLAVSAALVAQAAKASFTANDLYLGFNTGSAVSDYIIDLSQPSVVGVGGALAVNLSADFSASMFATAFPGGPAGVNMGVVGGQNQFPSSYDLYATGLRVGGGGNASTTRVGFERFQPQPEHNFRVGGFDRGEPSVPDGRQWGFGLDQVMEREHHGISGEHLLWRFRRQPEFGDGCVRGPLRRSLESDTQLSVYLPRVFHAELKRPGAEPDVHALCDP